MDSKMKHPQTISVFKWEDEWNIKKCIENTVSQVKKQQFWCKVFSNKLLWLLLEIHKDILKFKLSYIQNWTVLL